MSAVGEGLACDGVGALPALLAADELRWLRGEAERIQSEAGRACVRGLMRRSRLLERFAVGMAAGACPQLGGLMKPLLLHASARANLDGRRHRRVLHIEYAPLSSLAAGLQWHECAARF